MSDSYDDYETGTHTGRYMREAEGSDVPIPATPNSFDELKAKVGDLIDGYTFAKKRDKDVAINDILNLYLTHPNNSDTPQNHIASAHKMVSDGDTQVDGLRDWFIENAECGRFLDDDREELVGTQHAKKTWAELQGLVRQHIDRVVEAVIGEDYNHGDVLDGVPLPKVHRDLLMHEHAKQRLRYKQLKGGS